MKPKAPKKKDPKPNCKTGEVRYGGYEEILTNSNFGEFKILFSIESIKEIKNRFI